MYDRRRLYNFLIKFLPWSVLKAKEEARCGSFAFRHGKNIQIFTETIIPLKWNLHRYRDVLSFIRWRFHFESGEYWVDCVRDPFPFPCKVDERKTSKTGKITRFRSGCLFIPLDFLVRRFAKKTLWKRLLWNHWTNIA